MYWYTPKWTYGDICKQPFIHHYISKFRSWRPSWLQKQELDLIPAIGLKQLAQHLCDCMHLKVSSYWKLVFWDWRWLTVHRGALCFTLRNASGWALIVIVVRGAGCYSKIVQATSFKKPSPGEAITDLLVFIISPMKHLQLCYGDVLLWDSSMGNIGVNVSLETCSNDSNRTVCYLQLCYLACTKNRAINSLINCIIVTFYPCAILH